MAIWFMLMPGRRYRPRSSLQNTLRVKCRSHTCCQAAQTSQETHKGHSFCMPSSWVVTATKSWPYTRCLQAQVLDIHSWVCGLFLKSINPIHLDIFKSPCTSIYNTWFDVQSYLSDSRYSHLGEIFRSISIISQTNIVFVTTVSVHLRLSHRCLCNQRKS